MKQLIQRLGLMLSLMMATHGTLAAEQATVDLGMATSFALLAGSAITSGGGTINGDVGLSPGAGSFITGLLANQVTGKIYAVDASGPTGSVVDPELLSTSKADFDSAYSDAAGRNNPTLVAGGALGGLTLFPGLYKDDGAPASLDLTGTLTLDAQGDPTAVWIFQSASTLITAAGLGNSQIILAGGAQPRNVFWQVGSSATIGTYSVFKGTILAAVDITMNAGCSVEGRGLAGRSLTFSGQDIGLSVQPNCYLGGCVWHDLDGNGIQDLGEPGMANLTVHLYDNGSNFVALADSDVSGVYAFTNLFPGVYYVRTATPAGYTNTLLHAGGDTGLDSDVDEAGWSGARDIISGEEGSDVDIGLYMPALLDGYLFKDNNSDLLRNTGDSSITNAWAWLVVSGVIRASALSDAQGYYTFENVPAGSVSVLVSRVSATLSAVPTEGDAATDERRNRAVADNEGLYAIIVFGVTSGYGVLAEQPAETLNFGFSSFPLSTAIDVSLYATSDGVMITLWTVNESGHDDIVIYAWINNAWAEVGRVPSRQIVGEGSNRYSITADGLAAGGLYFLKIVDEVGHVHYSGQPVEVMTVRLEMVRLDMETLTMAFNTEHGRSYVVKVSNDLVNWVTEYVSHPTASGPSEYVDTPFTAGLGTQTQVLVPLNGRPHAFFKVVIVEE